MKLLSKYKYVILFVLLVAGVIFGGQYLLNSSNTSTSAVGKSETSTTSKVSQGSITQGISASGQVQTANYLPVTTSVNGIVKSVFVKEGDKVYKGQKIIEVTLSSEGEKSLLSANAQYMKASNALTSTKNNLYSLQLQLKQKEKAFDDIKKTTGYSNSEQRYSYRIAELDYQSAKSKYDELQSEISQLEVSLSSSWQDYLTQSPIITAPSDGVVANVVAVEGAKIENSVSERSVQTVASIKKEGTPIASVNVTEIDINSVKVGQKVKLTLNSVPNQEFSGKVAGIDKIGTVSNGVSNYPVIIKFDEASEKVLPNMGVEASIVVDEKADVLYVPTSAIKTSGSKKTVTLVSETETKQIEVVTGISDTTNTEIVSGLKLDDSVQISALPTSGFTSSSSSSRNSPQGIFGIFGGNVRR